MFTSGARNSTFFLSIVKSPRLKSRNKLSCIDTSWTIVAKISPWCFNASCIASHQSYSLRSLLTQSDTISTLLLSQHKGNQQAKPAEVVNDGLCVLKAILNNTHANRKILPSHKMIIMDWCKFLSFPGFEKLEIWNIKVEEFTHVM